MKVQLQTATPEPAKEVATAARNDYLRNWVGDMTFEEVMDPIEGDTLNEKKRNFVEGLLHDRHFGPFEHVMATFQVKGISRVCMAQITRHRHATFDVQSLRYVAPDDPTTFLEWSYDDDLDKVREYVVIPQLVRELGLEESFLQECLSDYKEYAMYLQQAEENGIPRKRAKQDARFKLPMATKVNMVVSANARMLMHVADMRAAGDAQWEIREMTEEVLNLAAEWFPECFDYYEREMKDRKNRLAP